MSQQNILTKSPLNKRTHTQQDYLLITELKCSNQRLTLENTQPVFSLGVMLEYLQFSAHGDFMEHRTNHKD